MKHLVVLPLVSLLLAASSTLAAEENVFPGKKTKWQGFDMYKEGGRMVVVPAKVADGKPWVWRARFFGHEPQFDVALLKRGYHLVYCNVGGLYGSNVAVERWNAFYKYLREERGFAEKAVLEGMSRGGLIIYNWGIANPEKVAVIYGDAPVMDFKSWPGHANGGILKSYGFKNAEEAKAYKGNPVDNLKPLAEAGVPIIHVVGDADTVVPVSENTAIAEKRYKEMGGVFKVIHKEKVGHHPHSLKDPAPLVDFVLEHTTDKKEQEKFIPEKAEKADAVLRVTKTKSFGGSKWQHCLVKVLEVYKNETETQFEGKEIRVAYYGVGSGLPNEEVTIYIAPYNANNPAAKGYWKLIERVGPKHKAVPGFSHLEKK